MLFDLVEIIFLVVACVVSTRHGLRTLAADRSFRRSGVVVVGDVVQIDSVEAGTFSVFRFQDASGRFQVVRTPGDDVLASRPSVELCYIPDDASRVMIRRRLRRTILNTVVSLIIGGLTAAAAVLLLVPWFRPSG